MELTLDSEIQVDSMLVPVLHYDTLHFSPHRRRKLQVLDMRVVHQDFWDAWAEKEDSVCSAVTLIKKQGPECNLGYPLEAVFSGRH